MRIHTIPMWPIIIALAIFVAMCWCFDKILAGLRSIVAEYRGYINVPCKVIQ